MTAVVTERPRLAMTLRLIAGRGAFRAGMQVMAVALVAVWGAATFGHYANALGLCAWLGLVTTAPEKAALKQLPRTRMLTAQLARLTLRSAAAPVVVGLAVLVPVLVLAPGSATATYVEAAVWFAATGTLMTVSGLHRLRGVPGLDAGLFGCAAVLVLIATALTWVVQWSPQRHLLVLVAGTVLLLGLAIAALPRDWVRADRAGPPPRRLLGRLTRNTWLLGTSDLLDALTPAAVYLVLALTGRTADSGPLYLLLLLSTMISQFVFYQLRLAQPAASARLRGTGGDTGRSRAALLLRGVAWAGAAFAVLFLAALALPVTRSALDGTGPATVVTLGLLLCVEVSLYLPVLYATFLLENTNNRVLTRTVAGSAIGLATTAVFAVLLVPPLGAAGGLAALALAVTARAAALHRLLGPQSTTSAS